MTISRQTDSAGTGTGREKSTIPPQIRWVIGMVLAFGLGLLIRASWATGLKEALVNNKDAWGTIQTILTVLGVPVAVWWWMARRQRFPRADLALTVVHRELQPGVVWIRVRGALTNKGDVKIGLDKVSVYVQQVVPPPPSVQKIIEQQENPAEHGEARAIWESLCTAETRLSAVEVEPGEVDVYDWDFFIYDPDVKTVLIYMYIANVAKANTGNLGWSSSIVYDLVEPLSAPKPAV